jgi:hypothetical protein
MLSVEAGTVRREAAMIPRKLRDYLQHRLNPVHIYCRLRDMGLGRCKARRMTVYYARIYSLTWLG